MQVWPLLGMKGYYTYGSWVSRCRSNKHSCGWPQDLSDIWLAGKSFVGGDDICIADLSICCELQMLELMDGSVQVLYRKQLNTMLSVSMQ